jgi:hypothetical protein
MSSIASTFTSPTSDGLTRPSSSASVSGSLTFKTVTSITLTPSKKYRSLAWLVSSFRNSEFKIVGNNNSVLTDLVLSFKVGDGDFSDSGYFENFQYTAGGTGTQELILQGRNQTTLADMSGAIFMKELAS